MRVWRIARSKYAQTIGEMLSGDGAARYGGRWNPKGVKAVYSSENSSLAALEILANLTRPSAFPPHNVIDLDVPDDEISVLEAPSGDMTSVGARLLRENLAVAAPSVVNPLERNVIVNPTHPSFGRIVAGQIRPFLFDERLRH